MTAENKSDTDKLTRKILKIDLKRLVLIFYSRNKLQSEKLEQNKANVLY